MKRYCLILALSIICLVTQIESVQATPIILDMKAVVTEILPGDLVPGIGLGDEVSVQYIFDPSKYEQTLTPDVYIPEGGTPTTTLESSDLGLHGWGGQMAFHTLYHDLFHVGDWIPSTLDSDPSIAYRSEFWLYATTDVFGDIAPGTPHPDLSTFAAFDFLHGEMHIAGQSPTDIRGITLEITESCFHAAPVPEPATLLLLGSGLVGMVLHKKRKKG